MTILKLKKTEKWNAFDMISDRNKYLTLVQFMKNLVNVSCTVTIACVWIFDVNCKSSKVLVNEILDLMC